MELFCGRPIYGTAHIMSFDHGSQDDRAEALGAPLEVFRDARWTAVAPSQSLGCC